MQQPNSMNILNQTKNHQHSYPPSTNKTFMTQKLHKQIIQNLYEIQIEKFHFAMKTMSKIYNSEQLC